MKIKLFLAFFVIFIFCFTSCEILDGMGDREGGFRPADFLPTTDQMISALKEALTRGATDASDTLNKEDAYYRTERKIPLPPEAKPIMDFISNSSITSNQLLKPLQENLLQRMEDVVLRINRAAEKAAKDVAKIFGDAILSMTFDDALTILRASPDEAAATEYLIEKTYEPLKLAFKQVLDVALGEPIVGSFSALSTWDTLTSTYNDFGSHGPLHPISLALVLLNIKIEPINTDLSEFVLDKALTAVFAEMAELEKKIRAIPAQFLSDLSTRVFNWARN